jgi:F-type H+-transporting ATPase subunit delta
MNNKVIEVLNFFAQMIETTETAKRTISSIVSNFFQLLIEIISQFLFFLLCLLPFVGGLAILGMLIWQTIRYFLRLFSTLEESLAEDTILKEHVQKQVIRTEKKDHEKERANWQSRIEQLVEARAYYQKEYEKLSSELEKIQARPCEPMNVLIEPVEIKVPVPDKALNLALYKSDMKKQLRTVLSSVEGMAAKAIYQEAIEEFTSEMFVMQIRYALPYKVILRLFEMYNEEKLRKFYQSFNIMMDALNGRKYKKIYRNTYYSSEQKIQLFAQFGLLDKLDKEFIDFLFYLLNRYSYRQVRELYQHFQKVWSIRHYQGTVKVILPSETEISVFKELWDDTLSYCTMEFVIDAEIKKGVIIQTAQTSVDLSYHQLIDQNIDLYEMEVSL